MGYFPSYVGAQSTTATVSGVVTDQTNASLPGATVTITDVERNTQQAAMTDGAGRYVITSLPPGTYRLTVELFGFRTYSRGPFELRVQQHATVNPRLEVGQVETNIVVESSAPLLNTTISTLGEVVDNKALVDLPIAGRSPLTLTYLAGGVVPSNDSPGGPANTNFVANGTRNATADVLLDGMSITNPNQNTGGTQLKYQPAVDAIQEFKIQTNFFSAEFGNTGSAVINMVTKSGTGCSPI